MENSQPVPTLPQSSTLWSSLLDKAIYLPSYLEAVQAGHHGAPTPDTLLPPAVTLRGAYDHALIVTLPIAQCVLCGRRQSGRPAAYYGASAYSRMAHAAQGSHREEPHAMSTQCTYPRCVARLLF